MHITLNKMEQPKEAYCDECTRFAQWWTSADGETIYYYCNKHAKQIERIANEAQTLVEWCE